MNTIKTSRPYEDLYSREFQRKLAEDPNGILLDVRTPEEFGSERIPESVNVDVMDSSFIEKISSLDKTKTYFVYCRSGGRSGQACAIMAKQGFKVYNLAGGITAWTGEIC
jgi:rhodanese-related sulfurtransferase